MVSKMLNLKLTYFVILRASLHHLHVSSVIILLLQQAPPSPLYLHPLPSYLIEPLLLLPSLSSPWLRLSWQPCQRWLSLVERVSHRQSSFARDPGAAHFARLASPASFLCFVASVEVHHLVSFSPPQGRLP